LPGPASGLQPITIFCSNEDITVSESVSAKNAHPLWQRLDNGLLRLVTWAARLGGLMILLVGLFVLYEVVCRYAFQSPTLWVMDYSIYFVMWAVLLGSAYTMRTRGHVLVDVVVKKISPANRRIVQIGIHSIILAFTLTITAAGLFSCIRAYQMKELTLSALYIPLYYPMSSIPVGFGLMTLEEIGTLCSLIVYKDSDMRTEDETLP
jgi:TRAP-type C4-dicarboxylate transport system permease small subunit